MRNTLGFLLLSSIVLTSDGAFGDEAAGGTPAKVISGEVAYSDPNAKGRNHQLEALDDLQSWTSKIEAAVRRGGEGEVGELSSDTSAYLSVLYFYCTVKNGPCPFILETLLDAELVNSRGQAEVACTSMKRFFKSYLVNDLDERGKFTYSLTRGLEMATFNSDSRVRFLECKETVTAIRADKEALGQRFGEKGTSLVSLLEFQTLLKEVKESKTDVFAAADIGQE